MLFWCGTLPTFDCPSVIIGISCQKIEIKSCISYNFPLCTRDLSSSIFWTASGDTVWIVVRSSDHHCDCVCIVSSSASTWICSSGSGGYGGYGGCVVADSIDFPWSNGNTSKFNAIRCCDFNRSKWCCCVAKTLSISFVSEAISDLIRRENNLMSWWSASDSGE